MQRLLDDLYADMPGLPASLICDGAELHQPRFIKLTENQQQQGQQQSATVEPTVPGVHQTMPPPPNNPSPNKRIIRATRLSVQNPTTSTVSIIRPSGPGLTSSRKLGSGLIEIDGSQAKNANPSPPVRLPKHFVKPLSAYIPNPVVCSNPRAPGFPIVRPAAAPTASHSNQEDKDVEIIEVDGNNSQPPPRRIIVPATATRVSIPDPPPSTKSPTTTTTADILTTSVRSCQEEDMEVIEIDKE